MEKPNCYECQYKGNNPGDAHIRCLHPLNKTTTDDPLANVLGILGGVGRGDVFAIYPEALNIKANPHGIKNGWFNYPINFDPCWLENCDGFKPKEKKDGDSKMS